MATDSRTSPTMELAMHHHLNREDTTTIPTNLVTINMAAGTLVITIVQMTMLLIAVHVLERLVAPAAYCPFVCADPPQLIYI